MLDHAEGGVLRVERVELQRTAHRRQRPQSNAWGLPSVRLLFGPAPRRPVLTHTREDHQHARRSRSRPACASLQDAVCRTANCAAACCSSNSRIGLLEPSASFCLSQDTLICTSRAIGCSLLLDAASAGAVLAIAAHAAPVARRAPG